MALHRNVGETREHRNWLLSTRKTTTPGFHPYFLL